METHLTTNTKKNSKNMPNQKLKILVIGPSGCGKTKISNFLGDIGGGVLPEELRSTTAVRIVEFEVGNLRFKGNLAKLDIELWDTSGDESYMECWPAIRKDAAGVIFVYSPNDDVGARKLDLFHDYFVAQAKLSPRQCLVCALPSEDAEIYSPAKLSSAFARISQITMNLDDSSDKFRQDFSQFLLSVLHCI